MGSIRLQCRRRNWSSRSPILKKRNPALAAPPEPPKGLYIRTWVSPLTWGANRPPNLWFPFHLRVAAPVFISPQTAGAVSTHCFE